MACAHFRDPVPDAGHVIHDDQLDVVIAAVLRMP